MRRLSIYQRILSIIIGIITGLYLGWITNLVLITQGYDFIYSLYILSFIWIITLGFMAFKFPRTTEILIAGGVFSLIVVGAGWDAIINDWSSLRFLVLIFGLGILILDILLGSITIFDFIKMMQRFGGKKI